jgi:hypothetical protein
VTQIDLALGYIAGTNGATVSLWTDNSDVPGSELGFWAVSNQGIFGDNEPITTISGITGVDLLSGDSYFLVVAPADGTTEDAWNYNDQSVNLLHYDPPYSAAENTASAFDVLGTSAAAVPEPGSLALLSSSLIGFRMMRRRKRKAA